MVECHLKSCSAYFWYSEPLFVIFLMVFGISAAPGAAEDFPCAFPPFLKITGDTYADACQGAFDGINTQLYATFKFTAAMLGTGDKAPQFESFLDGVPTSCQEQVTNRTMDGHTQSGVLVVICTARLSEGSHSIEVSGVLDSGESGCVGSADTAFVTPAVITPPRITLYAPTPSELCYGTTAFSTIFAYQKSSSLQGVPVVYDAWLTQDGNTLQYCPASEAGLGIVATCDTNAAAGLPTGTYTIILVATVPEFSDSTGNTALCRTQITSATAAAVVVVKEAPVITITELEPKPVCLGSSSASAKFSYTIDHGGVDPVVKAVQPLGQITAGVSAMATDCTAELQEYSSSSGVFTVTCEGEFSYLNASWALKVAVAVSCASSTGSITAVDSAQVSTPRRQPERGHGIWPLVVRTKDTTGSSSSGNLNAVAAAGATGSQTITTSAVLAQATPALVTQTFEWMTPLSCCVSGTQVIAWARNTNDDAPGSTCFKAPVPGSSKKRCSKNHGFYNKGPLYSGRMFVVAQPAANAPNPMCSKRGGFEVGQVTARCEQGGRGPDLLVITLSTSKFNDPKARRFLFTCDQPAKSDCSSRWEFIRDLPEWVEDDMLMSEVRVELPSKCTCKNVYWAVREQGTYRDGVPMSVCKTKFLKAMGD